jgi:predicted CXXCH cytochrome family protein
MNDRWPERLLRSLAVGLLAAIGAGSLLWAQTVEEDTEPLASHNHTQAATTQPAQTLPSDEPRAARAADAAAENAARERFLSGLIGSKHDFARDDKSGGDLCSPCHTPHLEAAPRPLLDRRAPAAQPLRPYQAIDVELDGWSLLCLGCHDGTTAPGIYSSAHALTVSSRLDDLKLGSAGLRSHPVGIKYPRPGEDYHPAAAVEAAGLRLPNGRLQCTSCHDPHNTHRHAGMLRISNHRSGMCLTCHRL